MDKQIYIDWELRTMVKGKCTGVGCPIKAACIRYTSKEFDAAYGYLKPPHGDGGYFPKKCLNFLTNESHKPTMRPYEIQD